MITLPIAFAFSFFSDAVVGDDVHKAEDLIGGDDDDDNGVRAAGDVEEVFESITPFPLDW